MRDQGASVGAGGVGTGEMFLPGCAGGRLCTAAGVGGGGGQRSGAAAGDSADAVHLGRWVYLVDAADDLRADIKSGGYNPLALRFTPKDGALTPADSEVLALTLDGSVRAMAAAFELLPETKYTPVLRAAVYEGLYAVGAAVLHGTFRKRQRREEPIRKADTDYA